MDHLYFDKGKLRNDVVFVPNEVRSLSDLTGTPVRSGLENAILSAGRIVNVVSDSYGHLPNSDFFGQVEQHLKNAGISYIKQSINRDNRSFAVDYILDDNNIHVDVKKDGDKIRPMLRFTNSYDGSTKTSGHLGFFREVCSNGLHVAQTAEIGFSVRHRKNIIEVVMPEIEGIIKHFISNEFFSLHRKFEVMAETPIKDVKDFVREISGITGILNYARSEKNPTEPSKNAKIVMETIDAEAKTLHTSPNVWIGYNAFNAFLHGDQKTFDQQQNKDKDLFEIVYKLNQAKAISSADYASVMN